ncbi:hypothetical protein SDC9_100829 [bioreactor metagenome]|uniref:Uncharacterized protein n=1 Tax=bioreactor metagenome TaxID=1076179 RepID=A0A645AMB0_9ZZZZ
MRSSSFVEDRRGWPFPGCVALAPHRLPVLEGPNCWPPRALPRRTPTSSPRRDASRSRRSTNPCRCPICSIFRSGRSIGWSVTTPGRRRLRRPRSRAAPISTPSPGWRRSSRRSRRSRTSPRRCRCRSATTVSRTRRTRSTSARRRTPPTPRRCSSPRSS